MKLPDFLKGESQALMELLSHVYDPASMKPEDGRRNNVMSSIERKKLDSKAFQELWKRINGKSIYKVAFRSGELVENAINALDKSLQVPPVRYVVSEGRWSRSTRRTVSSPAQLSKRGIMMKHMPFVSQLPNISSMI